MTDAPPGSSAAAKRPGERPLILLVAVTGVLWLPLLAAERAMRRSGGVGIIDLELAGDTKKATRMLERLGREGRAAARASLLLDFPFLVAYGALHWHSAQATAEALAAQGCRDLAALGRPFAVAAVGAATFDFAENVALLLTVGGRPYAPVARRCAVTKFALLGVNLGYVVLGNAIRAARHRPPAPAPACSAPRACCRT